MRKKKSLKTGEAGFVRKTCALIPLIICLGIALACFTESHSGPERIRFASGTDTTTVTGETAGEKQYILGARKEQLMTVELTEGQNTFLFAVTDSGGNELDRAAYTARWTGVLPKTGDYHITVSKTDTENTERFPYAFHVHIPASESPETLAASGKITGLYVGETGSISAQYLPENNTVRFYLSAFYHDHFGEICAVETLTNGSVRYQKEDCDLLISFGGDWVFVNQRSTDADCGFGLNVTAHGVYHLKNRETPSFDLCP
jgi:hypothetical protein